jgi:acetyltransferase
MSVPTALASAADAADAVVTVAQKHRRRLFHGKPILAVWIGDEGAASKRFEGAGVPQYGTETDVVRGFMHLVRYREAFDALMETPPSMPADFSPDVGSAERIVSRGAGGQARLAQSGRGREPPQCLLDTRNSRRASRLSRRRRRLSPS